MITTVSYDIEGTRLGHKEDIHTEDYLSEKSVRCFCDCVCKWRVQMACTCLAGMFLAATAHAQFT